MANSMNTDLMDRHVRIIGETGTYLVTGGFGAQADTSGTALFVTELETGLRLRFGGYDVEQILFYDDETFQPIKMLPAAEVLADCEFAMLKAHQEWLEAAEALAVQHMFAKSKNYKEIRDAAGAAFNRRMEAGERLTSARWRAREDGVLVD